ncbi:MAG: hypothetical protein B7Y58_02165 [Halothiobacillus sp. 35-54-62]|jgi:hypothetical protein|nr:MAG: hypothetical protein B7Y58_02165 [Halothiobacillus sp. 35-54-62]HQS02009.1 DUF6231 family protein [Halothiobacillus sp.]HQS28587.1 DUF6231 family protein [Halothiobacillus sp.]
MMLFDSLQLSTIAARLPDGVVRDDLLQSDLSSVRSLNLNAQTPAAWRAFLAQPELLVHLRAVKWVIVDLEQTEALDASRLQTIAFMKNLGWCRVIVLPKSLRMPTDYLWVAQLKALGFLLQGDQALSSWCLVFDVGSYKAPPDWLNARHWANPQLWDKHRW